MVRFYWTQSRLLFSYAILVVFCSPRLSTRGTPNNCKRKEKVKMIVVSFNPLMSDSTSLPLPHYQCFLGAEDGDAEVTSSRPFNTNNGYEAPPSPAILITAQNLPTNTAVYDVSLDVTDNNAFGVFTCDAFRDGRQNTTIMSIFLRSDGYIFPADEQFTKRVNKGDKGVVIDMKITSDTSVPLDSGRKDIRWRVNGSGTIYNDNLHSRAYQGEDFEKLKSHPITVGDGGVYESHIVAKRNGRHGLQRLIIRSCVAGKWGPPGCNGVCDYCYNGGVCDDETGRCICPPGFMGKNCLTECGANTFGYNCEFKCDYTGTNDCARREFCLLDPYGCTCNTGYKSLNCTSKCGSGKFGAGCIQECHCDEDRCDRFTGKCKSGRCQNGWSGTNCQIPEKCPLGYFGNYCTEKCFCSNDSSCDKETGACSNGECGSGSIRTPGSFRCQECPKGYYGNSCLKKCHCESDACDKTTGECVGCCHPQWIDTNTQACQKGIHNSSYTKVNPGLETVISCVANEDTVVLSRERERLEDQGVNQTSVSFIQPTDDRPIHLFNASFLVSNVSSTDLFYCQLWSRDSSTLLAWLNTTFSPNELPVFITPPSSPSRSMNSVTIKWRPWEDGIDVGDPPVVGYILYYSKIGAKEWLNLSFNKPMEFTVADLEEDTIYQFSVAVVRYGKNGKGPMGPVTTVKTLCRPPEAPTNVESSLTDDGKVNVSWQIPLNMDCSTGVTSFTIYAHGEGMTEEVIVVGYPGEQMSSNTIIEGLEPGARYEFQVSLTTDQESAYSNKSGVILIPMTSARSTTVYIVVCIVIVFLFATTILVGLLRSRRRKKFTPPCDNMIATYNKETVIFRRKGADYENSCFQSSEEGDHCNLMKGPKVMENGITIYVSCEHTLTVSERNSSPILAREDDQTVSLAEEGKVSDILNDKEVDGPKEDISHKTVDIYGNIPTAVSVSTLPKYYSKNKNSLIEEFHLLKKGQQYPWIVGTKPENKKKNRYRNLYTYDHSRVIIRKLPDDENSDYFNASYIPDQHGNKSFIASQAPKANSVNDFWRMIWSEEVTTVVMLTNLVENGKDRCFKYWPEEEGDSKVFGIIVVSWTSTSTFADFIVRKLQVAQGDVLREVYQVHFTAWPDMDVPSEITPVINCIQHTKTIHEHNHSPVLIHCSAGVGRSGTFISIYCLMEVIEDKEKINVFKFVEEARQNRINFVQTENQYTFIYKCLVDYHLTRHTVKSHADILTTDFNMGSERKILSDEFKLLTHFNHHQNSKFGIGEDRCLKNRFRDIEPNDSGRVFLISEKRTSFSNYINATLFRSITKNDAFISTQSPLPNTIEDFWRLIYEWKCPLIIMLNELDLKDETCVQYWPDEGTTDYGNISVSFRDGRKCSSYFTREFQVSHIEHGDTRKVHQLQLLSWPEDDDFSPLQMIRNYVRELLGYLHHDEGPVVIHCIDGISRSCIYIALECAVEQMQISQTADVFTIVRQMRHRNSFAIRDEEEYVFIYQALQYILQAV